MKCSSVAILIAFAAFVICCHVSAYCTTHSCRSFCGVHGTRGRIQCTSTSTAFLEDVPRAFRILSRPSGNAEDVIRSDDAGVIRATRMGIVLTAFLLLRYTTAINASIASLWSFLQGYSVFRHDLFEPAVAVSSFFLWIHAWYLADSLAIKGYFPALLRRRIAAPIKKEPSESIRAPQWYVGYWYREFPVYMIPLWFLSTRFDAFAPRRLALSQAAPTVFRIMREVLGGLFLYDLFFWMTHRVMHKIPLLYRYFHRTHHTNSEVRAGDAVRVSVVEQATNVICSIAALRVLNAHPISRSLYNFVITGLLVELHCGYDLPFTPQNVVPFRICAGSRRHHAHHRSGSKYYQKFFTYLDDTFRSAPSVPSIASSPAF